MTIDHARTGSGEPLLLIHGIGHRREAWGTVPRLLASRYDVVSIDLPGFGRSPRPAPPDTGRVESLAEQVARWLPSLGVERPHVVGNSLGGIIALHLAAAGHASSVTALAPAGFATRAGTAVATANLVGMRAGSYMPALVLRTATRSDRIRRLAMRNLYENADRITPEQFIADTLNLRRSKGFWPTFAHSARGFTLPEVPADLPLTIAWGTKDKLLLPSQAERARAAYPHARIVKLPRCGHVPMVDDPDLVVRVVGETVARVHV
jgi:pimeloyl-ACP methyl ester carboxylesterase